MDVYENFLETILRAAEKVTASPCVRCKGDGCDECGGEGNAPLPRDHPMTVNFVACQAVNTAWDCLQKGDHHAVSAILEQTNAYLTTIGQKTLSEMGEEERAEALERLAEGYKEVRSISRGERERVKVTGNELTAEELAELGVEDEAKTETAAPPPPQDPNASLLMKISVKDDGSGYSYSLGMDYEMGRLIDSGQRTIIHLPAHWNAWLQVPARGGAVTLPEARVAGPQPGDEIAFSVGMPKVRLRTIVSVTLRRLVEPIDEETLSKLAMGADECRARWGLCWALVDREGGPWPLADGPEVYEIEWETP